MKRILAISILIISMLSAQVPVFAVDSINTEVYSIGKYYQMGKYRDEPILWRCVDIDNENGVLLLSDKILCYKKYDVDTPKIKDRHSTEGRGTDGGNYLWEESALRDWLNSDTDHNGTEWHRTIPEGVEFNPYDGEEGFLSDNNFSESERSVMKTVNQWQLLHYLDALYNENGVRWAFGHDYSPEGKLAYFNDVYLAKGYTSRDGVPAFSQKGIYRHVEGAMYRATDTVFLLNGTQIYNMVQNLGTEKVNPTQKAKEELYANLKRNMSDYPNGIKQEHVWWSLTMGMFNEAGTIVYASDNNPKRIDDDYEVDGYWFCTALDRGVRPAFYLNEETAEVKSGKGTKEDPYVLDGKVQEGTVVFCNGEQMKFDEQPIYENDRLLVPVRAIFEELGAEVNWNDEDKIITAGDGEHNIVMQIDNAELGNGSEVVTLDVPPRLVGDRTMVPLRAVSKSLGATVRYIANLDRVSVDKPTLPMDFGEGTGCENWQKDTELRQRMEADNCILNLNFVKNIQYIGKKIATSNFEFVPLRFLSENLGYDVQWDEATNTAIITTE